MKITCIDKDLKSLLESGYYIIPRFQRPYLWERDNVEEYWADAIVDRDGDHFIGSMVFYRTKDNKLAIVDGQQRLTTITLLLCALRNALEAGGLQALAQGVHHLVERPDIANENQYVLQTETSYPFFQEHIQKFGPPDVAVVPGQEEQLLNAAFSLLSEYVGATVDAIKSDSSLSEKVKASQIRAKLSEVRDSALSTKLIFIELENEDDAYILFETLNTRGKDLRPSDLVKNHITRLYRPKNANVDVPKDRWNAMVRLLMESEELSVDTFLHHYWLSKYEYVTARKLFKSVKKLVRKENVKGFLDELCSDSMTYREILDTPFRKWSKQEASISRSLEALNAFRVKQDIPMVLAIMRDYRGASLKLKNVTAALEALENFHFAFTAITSQRSSGGISLMYAALARKLTCATDAAKKVGVIKELVAKLRERMPSYQEFEANFLEKRSSKKFPREKALVRYVLERLYGFLDHSGVAVDFSKMTIEHIAPENPQKGSDPEVLDLAVAQIGNLILVDDDLNNRLSNKPFVEKKQLLLQSSVWVDEVIKSAQVWGEKEIEARTRILARLAFEKVWQV